MKKDKSRKLTSDEQNFILALYKIEYENLCKYADKMMKGSLAAEDLVQDTLIIACRKIDELIKHPKPGAFLMDTLRKNIYNYWRVRDNLSKFLVDIPIEDWINNYPDTKLPEDDLDLLYGDLAKTKEYEILKKFVVDGYSQKEIADEYGISHNTCRQRMRRAKIVLQQMIAERTIK